MVLKEHEESRLIRYKEAIDQYNNQLSIYGLDVGNLNITEKTRCEIEALITEVQQNLQKETEKMKAFVNDLISKNDISSFDKFADLVLSGLAEVEKILDKLPEDIRRPLEAVVEKLKGVIEFLKKIF